VTLASGDRLAASEVAQARRLLSSPDVTRRGPMREGCYVIATELCRNANLAGKGRLRRG